MIEVMPSDDGDEERKNETQSKAISSKAEATTARNVRQERSTQPLLTPPQYPRRKDSPIISTSIRECPTISFHTGNLHVHSELEQPAETVATDKGKIYTE